MPVPIFQDDTLISPSATLTHILDSVSSSEAASLHGHKAKTPIIAGSICGGLLAIGYIVGLIAYIMKRRRRSKIKAKEAASGSPSPAKSEQKQPEEKFIMPPDPAIVLGLRQPGEDVFGGCPKSDSAMANSDNGGTTEPAVTEALVQTPSTSSPPDNTST